MREQFASDDLQRLERRLDALERGVNSWRRVVAVTVVIASALLVAGWQELAVMPDYLYARRGFLVQDASGKTRLFVGIRSDGSVGMDIMDAAGRVRAFSQVSADKDGEFGFGVRDEKGSVRSFLGKRRGFYTAETLDERGQPLVTIGQDGPDSWGTVVFDDMARPRLRLGTGSKSDPKGLGMRILNEQGKCVIGFGRDKSGESTIRVADESGTERVAMGLDPKGPSFLRLSGAGESNRDCLRVEAGDSLRIWVKDKDGRPVDQLPAILKAIGASISPK